MAWMRAVRSPQSTVPVFSMISTAEAPEARRTVVYNIHISLGKMAVLYFFMFVLTLLQTAV
jgi:hypothetical protein